MFALTLPSSQLGRVLAGRYTLEKTLGKGSFGSVIRALDRATSSTVAVKVQKKYTKDSTMEIRQRREQSLHSKVSEHPNVVTFLHAFETPDAACIVLQYVPDGDLCSAIEKRSYCGDGPLISHCFDQLLDAVAFCHARGVYHRDIKPENILVSGDRRTWYLTDFGLATPNRSSSGAGIGTHTYMAPEVLGSAEFSRAVIWNTAADVWALGITLLTVLTSTLPWPRAARKEKKFAAYLANPQQYLVDTMPISSELAILLSEALAVDDAKRITARVFGHKLVQVKRLYNSTVQETGLSSWLAEEDTTAVWATQAPQNKRPSYQRPSAPQKVAPQARRNDFLAIPQPQAVPQARLRSPSPVGARSPSPAGPRSISPAGLRSTSPAGPRRAPLPAAPKKTATTSKKVHPPVTPRKAPATRKVAPAPSPAGPRKARPAPTPIQAPIMPAPPAPLPFFPDYLRARTIKYQYHDIPAAYLDISAYIRAPSTEDMYITPPVEVAPTPTPINVRPTLAPIVTRPMPLPPVPAFAAPSPNDAYHPILDIADYLYAPSPVDNAPSPTGYGPSPISTTPSPTRKRFLPLPPLPTPPALPDLAYNISTQESAMPVTPGAERDTMYIPTLAPDLKKQQVIAEAKRALVVPQERMLVVPEGAKQTLKMLGAQQAMVIPPPRAVKLVRREVARAVPLKVEVSVC